MEESSDFGIGMARLLNFRETSIRGLSDISGISEGELLRKINDPVPNAAFLRRIAPVLGLRTADLFVIAGVPVPEDLVPLDDGAGQRVTWLISRAVVLSAGSRRELLGFAGSLPQLARTGPIPELRAYERYPPGFGGVLMRLLWNRNVHMPGSAKTLAVLTRGRVYLSASTFRLMGYGRFPVTPILVTGFATVLGIPAGDLAALGGVDLPEAPQPPESAMADVAALLWEARRLTVEQVRQVEERLNFLRSQESAASG